VERLAAQIAQGAIDPHTAAEQLMGAGEQRGNGAAGR
jgi:hypothetical protein